MKKILVFFFFVSFILNGCKNKKNDDDTIIPAKILYEEALSSLSKGDTKEAAENFGKIFYQHPGDNIAPQSQLMHAYSLFIAGEYEEALDIIDVFIQVYPLHKDIAYAYYLKSMCFYADINSIYLDQEYVESAKESFEEIIRRFPNSVYAEDVKNKLYIVKENLAAKNMEIGRYYAKKSNPIAAINRFHHVLKFYEETNQIEEALYRMAESYSALGIVEEAKKYVILLAEKYPESKWTKYAEKFANN